MIDPTLKLIDRLIDEFTDASVDSTNVSRDHMQAGDEVLSLTYSTLGLAMAKVVSSLQHVKAQMVSELVDDVGTILDSKFPPAGSTPLPGTVQPSNVHQLRNPKGPPYD